MGVAVLVTFPIPVQREPALRALLRSHHMAVSKQPGYVRLRQLIDQSNPQPQGDAQMSVQLMLEFQRQDQLTAWRESQQHQQLVRKYQQLWFAAPVVTFFEIEEAW